MDIMEWIDQLLTLAQSPWAAAMSAASAAVCVVGVSAAIARRRRPRTEPLRREIDALRRQLSSAHGALSAHWVRLGEIRSVAGSEGPSHLECQGWLRTGRAITQALSDIEGTTTPRDGVAQLYAGHEQVIRSLGDAHLLQRWHSGGHEDLIALLDALNERWTQRMQSRDLDAMSLLGWTGGDADAWPVRVAQRLRPGSRALLNLHQPLTSVDPSKMPTLREAMQDAAAAVTPGDCAEPTPGVAVQRGHLRLVATQGPALSKPTAVGPQEQKHKRPVRRKAKRRGKP